MTNAKLGLVNFGPVDEAVIDIKPLTIIKGESNSGKTLILKLINSLNSVINNQHPELNISKLSFTAVTALKNSIDNEFFNRFMSRFIEYIDTEPSIDSEPFKITLEDFDILYREGIQNLANVCLKEKIANTYNTGLEELIKADRIRQIESEREDFKFSYKNISYENTQIENFPYINLDLENSNETILSIHFTDEVEVRMNSKYINSLNGKDYDFYFIFFYSSFAKEVLSKIFETANSYFLDDLNEDFIRFLLDNNIKSPFYDIGVNLENEILNASLVMENYRLYYKSESGEIPLSLASDSLKKMTNIVFHIKHILNVADYLIIDDIENHLDKKSISILAKYLARISEMGIYVILSTHSDYVSKEFKRYSKELNVYCL